MHHMEHAVLTTASNVLTSGALLDVLDDYVESTLINVWMSLWRRAYARERAELAEYEQVDLGGEG